MNLNLPPSLEAMLEHFNQWDRPQLCAFAHEACRLQREADLHARRSGIFSPRALVVPEK